MAHVQRRTELGQFVSALVDEVNQPITAIHNYLSACRRLAASGNQIGVQSALERMAGQTDRASEIIQRIRDYVRKRDIQMQPESLSNVIHEAVELTRWSIRGDKPSLIVQVDPADQHAEIDRVQVQQVLFNLMRNGLEAMQDQPRRELMVAATRAQNGMVEISVSDTGPGLPEEVRRQLFRPFVTIKPDGMGVGLSVCQGIIRQHGGRLWADDNAGGGTVFRFTVEGCR